MAMNFNMSQTTGAVESKGGLTPGIHKATFKGLKKDTLTSQNGDVFNVMTLMLDIEGFGEFKHNFFEPKSNERKESQWGLNASQLDHFMISVRQIIDALDPEIGKKIDSGELKLGGTFAQLVNGVAKEIEGFIGTEVEVKLTGFDEERFYNPIAKQMQHVEPYIVEDGCLKKCNIKPILAMA